MKVSIGTKIKEGPWGGGNLFAINLKNYLVDSGHKVVHDLVDDDIDIILITEPRKTSESSAFTDRDVKKYRDLVNNDVLIIHRINECDERKGTNYVNKYLIEANKVADETVYVSQWIQDLYMQQGINSTQNVIYAGADNEIFNSTNFVPWDGLSKISIVTHHWGGNWNKGFETYSHLDRLIESKKWKDKIEFTYIGNLPPNFKFSNTNVVKPLSGKKLSNLIKESHLYITGSLNEPSGNHHIEAAQCGLPILYLESGGTTEYCKGFGIGFKKNNFETKLELIIENYDQFVKKMQDYPHSAKKMSKEYLTLFEVMKKNKAYYLNLRSNKKVNLISKKIYLNSRAIKKKLNF